MGRLKDRLHPPTEAIKVAVDVLEKHDSGLKLDLALNGNTIYKKLNHSDSRDG